jgi:hypothetical protein
MRITFAVAAILTSVALAAAIGIYRRATRMPSRHGDLSGGEVRPAAG